MRADWRRLFDRWRRSRGGDGSLSSAFDVGEGFDGAVNSISIKGSSIFAVGDFSTCGGEPANGAARLTLGGMIDPSSGDSGLSVESNRASN